MRRAPYSRGNRLTKPFSFIDVRYGSRIVAAAPRAIWLPPAGAPSPTPCFRLSSFARLILFDKRGTGLSHRNVGFPTLDDRRKICTRSWMRWGRGGQRRSAPPKVAQTQSM